MWASIPLLSAVLILAPFEARTEVLMQVTTKGF